MAGLYIHVPFCRSKCAYCDFYSFPRFEDRINDYLESLEREWDLRNHEVEGIQTIYMGGGTPSILSSEGLDAIGRWLPVTQKVKEFTIEVNPDDVNAETVEKWQSLGVNRVSMGVQSLNDEELKIVRRRHSARQAIDSYSILRKRIDNISVDVIIGLPGQTLETLAHTLKEIIALSPSHVSAYILSYEKGTRLWAMRNVGKVAEKDDETIERMYCQVCEALDKAGYEHYEISNFALPGKRAIHNSSYWDGTPYLGLGPGAHSYDGKLRRVNPDNLNAWVACLKEYSVPFVVEEETVADKVNNVIMTRLRTKDGLNLNELEANYREMIAKNVEKLPSGRIKLSSDRLYIPEKEWLMSDDTISTLFIE